MMRNVVGVATIESDLAQFIDHFAKVWQVTPDDALRTMIEMAHCALEARDERAHHFARMRTDQIKRGYDAALAVAAKVQ